MTGRQQCQVAVKPCSRTRGSPWPARYRAGECSGIPETVGGEGLTLGGLRQVCAFTQTAFHVTEDPLLGRRRGARRIAYGQACRTSSNRHDAARSGLYVKKRGATARHLPRPKDAKRFGVDFIESVDLRGTRVAAVVADIYEYAFSQSVNGTGMRSFFAAGSEGEGDASARGLSLAGGNAMWTLVTSSHTGDPDQTLIFRQTTDGDLQRECLTGPGENGVFPAVDVAVDGPAMYLVAPSIGIVAHPFAPAPPSPTC